MISFVYLVWHKAKWCLSRKVNSASEMSLIIIIINKVCQQHIFLWLSLTTHPYQPSLLVSPLDCIHYSYIYWCVHAYKSINDITHEFVPTSLAVHNMSCSSYLDSLWDGRWVTIQLLFFRVLLPGFVQNSMQHSCVVPIKLFLQVFC